MDTELSIYIPSFEKGYLLLREVKEILKSTDYRFELIVVDDCSEDNTWELLESINDKRLKKYRNDKNLGAVATWAKAISLCTGHWIMHLNDRDEINVKNIPDYINYLSSLSQDVGVVLPDSMREETIYKKGRKTRNLFAFYICHPTGITIKKSILKTDWEKYFKYEKYGMYPHGYIFANIALERSIIRSDWRMWRESYSAFKSNKNFWNGTYDATDQKGLIYSDLPCVKHNLKCNINYIIDNYGIVESVRLIYIVYLKNLRATTFGYAKDIATPDRAHHYGLRCYTPTSKEMYERKNDLRDYTLKILKEKNRIAKLVVVYADMLWILIKVLRLEKWQNMNGF